MAVGLLVNAANIIIAYTLINGKGAFPQLDVLGSGAGFSGAAIIGGSLMLAGLASGTRVIHWYPWEALKFDPAEARRMVNVGAPAGLEQCSSTSRSWRIRGSSPAWEPPLWLRMA